MRYFEERLWILLGALTLVGACVGLVNAQEFTVKPPAAGEYQCKVVPPVVVPSVLPVSSAVLPGLQVAANLDFGLNGNIKDLTQLDAVAVYHDHWNTIANGTNGATGDKRNYGCETAATRASTVLPGVGQLVDASTRTFDADSILLTTRAKNPTQPNVGPARDHNCLAGSFMLKYSLPKAGSALGKDLVWETKFRMSKAVPSWWLALWSAGVDWQPGAGPELDVMESFSSAYNTPTNAWGFHGDSIGGTDQKPNVCIWDWPSCIGPWKSAGGNSRPLTEDHVWTYVYKRDDTWTIYVDNVKYASGNQKWRNSNGDQGMYFMIDCTLGQVQLNEVNNVVIPTAQSGLQCKIDYTRVWVSN